ncbi:MAG: hypothetical protein LAT82_03680 [Nanoarchaeota archaeon]|nr:hypothetical protein [Nanoarchaeota archaeon]
MAKYKVAQQSGALVDVKEEECPITKSTQFVEKYKGRLIIFDTNSVIAQKANKKHIGQYAIEW